MCERRAVARREGEGVLYLIINHLRNNMIYNNIFRVFLVVSSAVVIINSLFIENPTVWYIINTIAIITPILYYVIHRKRYVSSVLVLLAIPAAITIYQVLSGYAATEEITILWSVSNTLLILSYAYLAGSNLRIR